MLVPPLNYSMVDIGIFRCSRLDAINISFLKSLSLNTILWINEEKPPRAIRHFIEEHDIRIHHMTTSGTVVEEDINVEAQEWMVLKPRIVSEAIEVLLNVDNYNCLVVDTSDVIVGVLRHIQRWNYSAILNEYRVYANKTSYRAEIYLELVRVELVEPLSCPSKTEEDPVLHSESTTAVSPGTPASSIDALPSSLSRSPQIPSTLLRAAEQRRRQKPSVLPPSAPLLVGLPLTVALPPREKRPSWLVKLLGQNRLIR